MKVTRETLLKRVLVATEDTLGVLMSLIRLACERAAEAVRTLIRFIGDLP